MSQLMSKLYQSEALIQPNNVLERYNLHILRNVQNLISSKELELYILKNAFFGYQLKIFPS